MLITKDQGILPYGAYLEMSPFQHTSTNIKESIWIKESDRVVEFMIYFEFDYLFTTTSRSNSRTPFAVRPRGLMHAENERVEVDADSSHQRKLDFEVCLAERRH